MIVVVIDAQIFLHIKNKIMNTDKTTIEEQGIAFNRPVRCQLNHPFPKLYCAECGEVGWHGWLLPILFGIIGFGIGLIVG